MIISSKQRLFLALGLAVPVTIFSVARSAVSWRPQLVGQQSNVQGAWNFGHHFLRMSPDGKRLVSEGEDQITSTLWNLVGAEPKRTLKGTEAVFSKDSRFIATHNTRSGEHLLYDRFQLKWHKRLKEVMDISHIGFTSNNSHLQYHTDDPNGVKSELGNLLVVGDIFVTLDAQTGKELGRKPLGATIWQTESLDSQNEIMSADAGTKISRITPNADKLIFSLNTSNTYDQWDVAPDGNHLWVSQAKQNRFDIHDAKTGHKLWSYSSSDSNTGQFSYYPAWEQEGKTLVTIEKDTLIVRDSRTGKILLSHKNNLPAPLKSWAFTREGTTVYLMDAQGRIFRQRLR